MNPLERMLKFAADSHPELLRGSAALGGSATHLVIDGCGLLLACQRFLFELVAAADDFFGMGHYPSRDFCVAPG